MNMSKGTVPIDNPLAKERILLNKLIARLFICNIFIICLVGFSFSAFNPFVTLKIDNIDTTNYIVDLLVDNSKNEYKKANNEDKKEEENNIFQNIQKEYDEWVLANYYGDYIKQDAEEDPFDVSKFVKVFRGVYFGQYTGNNDYYHEFYANDDGSGPSRTDVYKIILINKDTGEVKISNEIKNIQNSKLIIDAKTMKVSSNTNTNTNINNTQIIKIVICVVLIIILLVTIIFRFTLKRK